MEKVIRDGMVAVVYSPDYGAGWYSWNKEYPEIVFDPTIVKYVLEVELDKLKAYMELKYPDVYIGTLADLAVAWLEEGCEFRIDEYDGNESIISKVNEQWFVA